MLGLHGTVADEKEVRKAYRQLAFRLHPDKNPSAAGCRDARVSTVHGETIRVLIDLIANR